jgi:hypothetical protein
MTAIYCSHKLSQLFGKNKISSAHSTIPNPFGDWNGHLFYFDRRKHLIFVNNKLFYSVVIENIKKADLEDFESLFLSRLFGQMVYDNVITMPDVNLHYERFQPVALLPTNNDKRTITTINERIFDYTTYLAHPLWYNKGLLKINHQLNETITSSGRNASRDYSRPLDDMKIIMHAKHP